MKSNPATLIASIGLVVVLAACSSTASSPGATATPPAATPSPSEAAPSPSGTTITATLTEFAIALSATSAPAGAVTFNVTNAGTMVHEFVILKTDILAKDLPVVDGAVVEDDYSPVGEVPETEAGKSGTFSATLAAGHYAIICNIKDHVAAGMVIDFTVN
jgi:uncharacterized cupredoxin-like copper-binding protein